MNKTYNIEDLRQAFKAGVNHGTFNLCPNEYEWIQQYTTDLIIEEKTIPVTLGFIRATCGWSKYCDITEGNHYMLNEWSVEDTEVFHITRSQAQTLGIIK